MEDPGPGPDAQPTVLPKVEAGRCITRRRDEPVWPAQLLRNWERVIRHHVVALTLWGLEISSGANHRPAATLP